MRPLILDVNGSVFASSNMCAALTQSNAARVHVFPVFSAGNVSLSFSYR